MFIILGVILIYLGCDDDEDNLLFSAGIFFFLLGVLTGA